MKSLFLSLFILLISCVVFGQTAEYKKFSLSVHEGMDFPIGTSNTAGIDPDFTLPFAKGYGGTFDGAYFFAKNYGIGLKYHLFLGKRGGGEFFEPDKAVRYGFKEMTYFIGPAIYGRWPIGKTRWEIPVNLSVGYVFNKLFDHHEARAYKFNTDELGYIEPNHPDKEIILSSYYDRKAGTIGVAMSAGIRYRIIPAIGIGVYANGMFASAEKQQTTDHSGNYIDIDVSRKMNRIGFSAGVDFSF